MGLFLIVGHWPKILPENSKGGGGQLNVCTVYVYCVWCTLFPPVAKICTSNFCQSLTTVKSGAYDMVWLNV